jgi:hypothetical protein
MRQRDFDERLTDALRSLLSVATRPSADRKRRALESRRTSPEPADQRKWRILSRRLRLCPTCWWDVDATNNNINNNTTGGDIVHPPTSVADGAWCHIRITMSYTHADDLRS